MRVIITLHLNRLIFHILSQKEMYKKSLLKQFIQIKNLLFNSIEFLSGIQNYYLKMFL